MRGRDGDGKSGEELRPRRKTVRSGVNAMVKERIKSPPLFSSPQCSVSVLSSAFPQAPVQTCPVERGAACVPAQNPQPNFLAL